MSTSVRPAVPAVSRIPVTGGPRWTRAAVGFLASQGAMVAVAVLLSGVG
ncbi:hypothetical protein ACTZWW_16070 [Salinarimonas sp. NSM]